jgi:hypothetical protein
MMRVTRSILAGAAAVASLSVLAAAAPDAGRGRYPDRPPFAHTGGFGEPTCHVCHFDSDVNAAGGRFTVSGAPEAYRAGETYRIVVRIARPEMLMGGFQLSARFADGSAAGRQAGTLRATDARAQVAADERGVQYASHTRPGLEQTSHWAAAWALEWTAPASAAGPVVIHASGNAGNGDGSQVGDFVYTDSVVVRDRPGS